jgi:PD-(D/E)XK nuclease superfamily
VKKPYVIKQRGLFRCEQGKPFKVSRSQIEAFCECPRCFYLNHRNGIRRPSSPPFTINSLVDRMLKREFDEHRAAQTPHPIMVQNGIDAVPFQHEMIEEWRNNFKGMAYLDERTNLKVTGALDDVWTMRETGRLAVVDYKATATAKEVTLDDDWKVSYKRQMEVYQWLLRKQGFEVEDRGFFLYANGQDVDGFAERLSFAVSLLPYEGNGDWIDQKLLDLKACLTGDRIPDAPEDCEFCGYVAAAAGVA